MTTFGAALPLKENANHTVVAAIAGRTVVDLPTGRLSLEVLTGPPLESLCDFAARANPKRGFLIVSKVLGRHMPATPAAMRETMRALAVKISGELPEPIVVFAYAETGTALGQGTFAALRELYPAGDLIYLQSSRQRCERAEIFVRFEEGHSHATSHLVQIADPELAARARAARSLVLIDDECSTGGTFLSGAQAFSGVMPHLERIETCTITDWSGGRYLDDMPVATQRHAILVGGMRWEASIPPQQVVLHAASNRAGIAPAQGMRSRTGLRASERSDRAPLIIRFRGERVLVLGDGEHSYEALIAAEEVEAQGGIAAVQTITRSPALVGHAMQSASPFSDAFGSGAPCYLYNILAHRPDRVVILTEIIKDQTAEATAAIRALGHEVPVETILCTYPESDS